MDGKHQVVWKKYCSFGIVCDCGTLSAPWSIDMGFRHGPSWVVWFWLELAFVMSFFKWWFFVASPFLSPRVSTLRSMSDAHGGAPTIQDERGSDSSESARPGMVPTPFSYNSLRPSRHNPFAPCRFCPWTKSVYQCWECNAMVCERCVLPLLPSGTGRMLCIRCESELFGFHRVRHNEAADGNDEPPNEGEEDEASNVAEDEFYEPPTKGPDTTVPPELTDPLPSSPPHGLQLQHVELQTLNYCWVCGNFVPILWPCLHCRRLTCRQPQCVSPVDGNVCANHILCQICTARPSVIECRLCCVHFCPECLSNDIQSGQEEFDPEIFCGECTDELSNPWLRALQPLAPMTSHVDKQGSTPRSSVASAPTISSIPGNDVHGGTTCSNRPVTGKRRFRRSRKEQRLLILSW